MNLCQILFAFLVWKQCGSDRFCLHTFQISANQMDAKLFFRQWRVEVKWGFLANLGG